jgi:hypothetical protein
MRYLYRLLAIPAMLFSITNTQHTAQQPAKTSVTVHQISLRGSVPDLSIAIGGLGPFAPPPSLPADPTIQITVAPAPAPATPPPSPAVSTPSVPASTTPTALGITSTQVAAWSRVNVCEEGGHWHVSGPVYSGGLGFSHANWTAFNTYGFPATAGIATPDEQIKVAVAFADHYWGTPDAAPDQNGCGTGY